MFSLYFQYFSHRCWNLGRLYWETVNINLWRLYWETVNINLGRLYWETVNINLGRLYWETVKLFHLCRLKKLVRPENFGPYHVCCQARFCATGRSLVQRSPPKCVCVWSRNFFRFMVPCIVVQYTHINISNEMQLYLGFYFKNSTCFGRSPCPSSGVTLLHRQPLVHTSAGLWSLTSVKAVRVIGSTHHSG
jgi:hypothetical protein